MIWHFRRVVPKTRSFTCYQKKVSSMKQADLRDVFKKAPKSVCTTNVVSPDTLSPTINFVNYEENNEENPEPADEGDIQMEYSYE
jgi:hypothetical protein